MPMTEVIAFNDDDAVQDNSYSRLQFQILHW